MLGRPDWGALGYGPLSSGTSQWGHGPYWPGTGYGKGAAGKGGFGEGVHQIETPPAAGPAYSGSPGFAVCHVALDANRPSTRTNHFAFKTHNTFECLSSDDEIDVELGDEHKESVAGHVADLRRVRDVVKF